MRIVNVVAQLDGFLTWQTVQLAQQFGPQQDFADAGFVARTNALMNLSLTLLAGIAADGQPLKMS